MERRYKDQLNLRFDEVKDVGFAIIGADEVLRWWDRQRLTASIWQDMQERWEERGFTDEEGESAPLLINANNHRYIIAWGAEGWLVPVTDWAG